MFFQARELCVLENKDHKILNPHRHVLPLEMSLNTETQVSSVFGSFGIYSF